MKNTNENPASAGGIDAGDDTFGIARKAGKQDVNLRKRGFLHFQLGLILAMILVYLGLETSFRMYQAPLPDIKGSPEPPQQFYVDLPPITFEEAPEKMARTSQSAVFEPVPDDTEIKLTAEVIQADPGESGDSDLDVGSIKYAEPPVPEEIPFWVIEEVPVFPGCEMVEKSERQACFQEKMNAHIQQHVRYPAREQELHIEGRVYVTFKIGTDGTISDIQLRGPSAGLEKEAERIIRKLPKMTPGKQRGRPVRVPFSIPITFELQ